MKEKISPICGAILCVVCFVVICVKLFGNYPPSNFNYIWLGGAIIGAMLAAPLFDKEK
jgi:integral membrane sensor domain MASE1